MKTKSILTMTLVMISLVLLGGNAWAEDIKERMTKRLPVIQDLKARGVVGENSQGYLSYLKGGDEQKAMVAAENADRKVVYLAIAKQQGTTAEHVGRRRALQIAEKAKAGEWLQNASGEWYQK